MSDKPQLPNAPYPDVDDALEEATRREPIPKGPVSPDHIPGRDASVRPHDDAASTGKAPPSTAEIPEQRGPRMKKA